jgi:uncharacterized BrkB/YihY/UPF0761 family membrane protein
MRTFTSLKILVGLALLILGTSTGVLGQQDSQRIASLESKVSTLERRLHGYGDAGLVLFLFGAFCALWAQNTRRSAWLWFFLGLFLNVITVILVLIKNSDDRKKRG